MGYLALVGLTVSVFGSYASVSIEAKKMPEPGMQNSPASVAFDGWVKHRGMTWSRHGRTGSLSRNMPLEGMVEGADSTVTGTQGSHGSSMTRLSQLEISPASPLPTSSRVATPTPVPVGRSVSVMLACQADGSGSATGHALAWIRLP